MAGPATTRPRRNANAFTQQQRGDTRARSDAVTARDEGPQQPLIDPEVFAKLPAFTEAERSGGRIFFDRLLSTQPGKLDAPEQAADWETLSAAMDAVGKVAQLADVIARITELEVLDNGGPEADAKAAANRARAAFWESSGVPAERRPMRAGVLGAEVSTNRQAFQAERLQERARQHEKEEAARAALLTPSRLHKGGLARKPRKPGLLERIRRAKKEKAAKDDAGEKPLAEKSGTAEAVADKLGHASTAGIGVGKLLDHVGKRYEKGEKTWTDATGQAWDLHDNSKIIGGLATGAGGLIGGAGGIGGGAMDLNAAIEQAKKGGIEGRQGMSAAVSAGGRLIKGAGGIAKSGVAIGGHVEKLQAGLHGSKAYADYLGSVATNIGGALGILSAVMHIKEAGMQGRSGHGLVSALDEDRSENAARDLAAGGMARTHAFKASISAGQAVGSTISAIGTFLGPPPSPGAVLKVVGSIVTHTSTAVEMTREAYVGGKVVEKELSAQYVGDSEAASGYVLKYGADHAAQILVRNAKQGDAAAIKALKNAYGVDEDDLLRPDKELRDLIKKALRQKDTRNFGMKLSQGVDPVRRYFAEGGGHDIQMHRADIAWRTAQAKNLMGYGGRRNRTEKEVRRKAAFRTGPQVEAERRGALEVFRLRQRMDKTWNHPKAAVRIEELLRSEAEHLRDRQMASRPGEIGEPAFDWQLYEKYHRPARPPAPSRPPPVRPDAVQWV